MTPTTPMALDEVRMDAPAIPAHLIQSCQSLVWAAAWEMAAKHVRAALQSAHAEEVAGRDAELAEIREILFSALDRDRDNITTRNLAAVANNALHFARQRAEQAEARLARVEADARRYAWLRDDADLDCLFTELPNDEGYRFKQGDELETAIDAALAAAVAPVGVGE